MTALAKVQEVVDLIDVERDPKVALRLWFRLQDAADALEYELARAAFPDECDPFGHYITALENGEFEDDA
jgi:hypothetical protein